jgi:hypothetical protein
MKNGTDRIKIIRQGDKFKLERSKSLLSDSMQKQLLADQQQSAASVVDVTETAARPILWKLAVMNPDKGDSDDEDDIAKEKRRTRPLIK